MLITGEIPGVEIEGVLGQGGYATVYRARQLSMDRPVAVKVDHRALASERHRRRFRREVTSVSRLSGHRHVVTVHDAGICSDWRPYLVMELCQGGSAQERLDAGGVLPWREVVRIGIGVADALAAAHAAGILHRDIKPANVLLDASGEAMLADFGIAAVMSPIGAATATREAWTPGYAAPEVMAGRPATPAADVYSLALTLHTLLTGTSPDGPARGRSLGRAPRHPLGDLPGVPRGLTGLLRAAAAPDARRRLSSAVEIRDRLSALRSAEDAFAVAAPRQPARPGRRVVASAAVAALAAAGVLVVDRGMPSRPPARSGNARSSAASAPDAVLAPSASSASRVPTSPSAGATSSGPSRAHAPGTAAPGTATPGAGTAAGGSRASASSPTSGGTKAPQTSADPIDVGLSADGSGVSAALALLQSQLGGSLDVVTLEYVRPAQGWSLEADVLPSGTTGTLSVYLRAETASSASPWVLTRTTTNTSGSTGVGVAQIHLERLSSMVAQARRAAGASASTTRAQWRYAAPAPGLPASWAVWIPGTDGGNFTESFAG